MPVLTDRIHELVDAFATGVGQLEVARPNEIKPCIERLIATVRELTTLHVPGVLLPIEVTLRNAVITGISEQLTGLVQLYVKSAEAMATFGRPK